MGDPLPARSRKPALPLSILPHRVFFKDASKPPRRKKKQRREIVGNWKLFVSPLADLNLSGLAKERWSSVLRSIRECDSRNPTTEIPICATTTMAIATCNCGNFR
jgi:hypothetical protein